MMERKSRSNKRTARRRGNDILVQIVKTAILASRTHAATRTTVTAVGAAATTATGTSLTALGNASLVVGGIWDRDKGRGG